MMFGLCTNFAADKEDPVGIRLLPVIKEAGFDYVELPLCQVASLTEEAFTALQQAIYSNGLTSPVACNLFPDDMVLRGGGENPDEITGYLRCALRRAQKLGIEKVVFASVSAWNTSGNRQKAQDEIVSLVKNIIAPIFAEYHIRLLIEGIRMQVCNVVNTVPEAAAIAENANHPSCGLMADLYHMICNGEPRSHLHNYILKAEHIHIADFDRKMPDGLMSPALEELIHGLQPYDGSISFEVRPPISSAGMRAARAHVLQRTV